LSDLGSLCFGTKSDLLTSFEGISDARSRTPTFTRIVFDRGAIEHMLNLAVCKNFSEYSPKKIFIPNVSTRFLSSSRLGWVCNTYIADLLRRSSRAKHGKGVCGCVVAYAAIPRIWQNFLRLDIKETPFKFVKSSSPVVYLSIGEVNSVSNVSMIPK
jgi:hypothetical protein